MTGTPTKLHPLRCVTCKNHTPAWECWHCTVCDMDLSEEDQFTIGLVGCASHSDAVFEREKVLNELEKYLSKQLVFEMNMMSEYNTVMNVVRRKIAELRKQGEQK